MQRSLEKHCYGTAPSPYAMITVMTRWPVHCLLKWHITSTGSGQGLEAPMRSGKNIVSFTVKEPCKLRGKRWAFGLFTGENLLFA